MTTKPKTPAARPVAKRLAAKSTKAVEQPVVNSTPATEPTAAPTAVESKLAKGSTPMRAQRNGISQPAAGTSCRTVWDAIDKLLAQDKKITLEAATAHRAVTSQIDATFAVKGAMNSLADWSAKNQQ